MIHFEISSRNCRKIIQRFIWARLLSWDGPKEIEDELAGMLLQRGQFCGAWDRQYFRVDEASISFSRTPQARNAQSIPYSDIVAIIVDIKGNYWRSESTFAVFRNFRKHIYIRAQDAATAKQWILAIRKNLFHWQYANLRKQMQELEGVAPQIPVKKWKAVFAFVDYYQRRTLTCEDTSPGNKPAKLFEQINSILPTPVCSIKYRWMIPAFPTKTNFPAPTQFVSDYQTLQQWVDYNATGDEIRLSSDIGTAIPDKPEYIEYFFDGKKCQDVPYDISECNRGKEILQSLASDGIPNVLTNWMLLAPKQYSKMKLPPILLLTGPAGADSSRHVEDHMNHGWLIQLVGKKNIMIWHESNPEEMQCCTLNPLEMLFIPSGWKYTAFCTTDSITLHWRHLCPTCPDYDSYQQIEPRK